MFNDEQIKYMKSINIKIDFDKKLLDEDLINIEEKVSERLQIVGFDKDYNITEEGQMCESILDEIS